ncbi:MAG: M48 family metallopeptidase [Candidatus Micrarchaeota archaeon]|nr:M48 family metallopeptidase [Candidatus Micrarchaeota archaeon]
MEEKITVNGKDYLLKPYRDYGKNAIAKLKGDVIYIKLPRHWNSELAWKIAEKLKNRMITNIGKGITSSSELTFYNVHEVTVLGQKYAIEKIEGENKRNRARIVENKILVNIIATLEKHKKKEVIDELVRRSLSRELLPRIIAKIDELNDLHFHSEIGKVSLRQQSSRWGSCSPANNISINFSLLFLPQEILDYVIVHELAHTKIRNHSEKFWLLVGKVMPDFRERRKWLKKEARKELTKIFNFPNPQSSVLNCQTMI